MAEQNEHLLKKGRDGRGREGERAEVPTTERVGRGIQRFGMRSRGDGADLCLSELSDSQISFNLRRERSDGAASASSLPTARGSISLTGVGVGGLRNTAN